MRIFDQLTSRPKFIAIGLAILVSLWLLSGLFGKKAAETDSAASTESTAGTMSVQIQSQVAEPVTRNMSIYGRTAPVRQVELKAETSGRVATLGVARGAMAKKGEVLLKLDLRDRQARLDQARAGVNQQESSYNGQLELKPQGYVSDTQLAETLATLETARAELIRAELDPDYMTIRAPFDGTAQERTVQVRCYGAPGHAADFLAEAGGTAGHEGDLPGEKVRAEARWCRIVHDSPTVGRAQRARRANTAFMRATLSR